ncbi:hypothetical protein N8526_01545 [Akkermansiaceae bacterium]|nr:hypothetical protein [Akkermansiaceae bacterium]MDC0291157.1 hypothetical protein [Akkermansiaceae bacterium]
MKFFLIAKLVMLRYKYAYLFLKRNLLIKPNKIGSVKRFKTKDRIVICGNGPSYEIFEEEFMRGNYNEFNTLLLNYGAFESKVKIDFHVSELPRKRDDVLEFISNLEKIGPEICKILRPRDRQEASLVRKKRIGNLHFIREKRIRQNSKKLFDTDLKQFGSGNVIFCRSSIVYATLFALELGYTEILYVGINPDVNSSWCSNEEGSRKFHAERVIGKEEVHPTFKKVGGINSYDVLKFISRSNLFKGVEFKIAAGCYDFLK